MALVTKQVGAIVSDGPTWLKRYFIVSSPLLWVDSATGSDANAGTSETAPKATVFGASGAYSVSVNGNATNIIAKANHAESIAAAFTWNNAGVTLVGLGNGSTRPRFTMTNALAKVTIGGASTRWENLYFPPSTAVAATRIDVVSGDLEMRDTLIEMGAADHTAIRLVSSFENKIIGTTFKATALGASDQIGIDFVQPGHLAERCTFDGGTTGFGGFAFNVSVLSADRFRIRECILNNYSVGNVVAGGEGLISAQLDATSRIDWAE
jgi:hypothetical protein